MSHAGTSLPYIDEHAVTIEADRQAVWRSLLEMPDAMISPRFARLLGCHVLVTRRMLAAVKRSAERH
jgi:hypothetical protein